MNKENEYTGAMPFLDEMKKLSALIADNIEEAAINFAIKYEKEFATLNNWSDEWLEGLEHGAENGFKAGANYQLQRDSKEIGELREENERLQSELDDTAYSVEQLVIQRDSRDIDVERLKELLSKIRNFSSNMIEWEEIEQQIDEALKPKE